VRRAVAQPRPRIRGAFGLEADKVAHRALEADGRWMQAADRGETLVATSQVKDFEIASRVAERHVCKPGLAPQADERALARVQPVTGLLPGVAIHGERCPGHVS